MSAAQLRERSDPGLAGWLAGSLYQVRPQAPLSQRGSRGRRCDVIATSIDVIRSINYRSPPGLGATRPSWQRAHWLYLVSGA